MTGRPASRFDHRGNSARISKLHLQACRIQTSPECGVTSGVFGVHDALVRSRLRQNRGSEPDLDSGRAFIWPVASRFATQINRGVCEGLLAGRTQRARDPRLGNRSRTNGVSRSPKPGRPRHTTGQSGICLQSPQLSHYCHSNQRVHTGNSRPCRVQAIVPTRADGARRESTRHGTLFLPISSVIGLAHSLSPEHCGEHLKVPLEIADFSNCMAWAICKSRSRDLRTSYHRLRGSCEGPNFGLSRGPCENSCGVVRCVIWRSVWSSS